MQDEVKNTEYDPDDWEKATYLVERGFIKSNPDDDKIQNIRETAINIHTVKMRGYDEYIKNGGPAAFEGK
jgi:hypothetical protein